MTNSWLPAAFEILSAATSSQDLCRRIVLHPVVGRTITGACIYALTNTGNYIKLGCYGLIPLDDIDNCSQFDDNLLSKTVNSQLISIEEHEDGDRVDSVIAIPGVKGGLPNGILLISSRTHSSELKDVQELETLSIVTNALGLFISSTGVDKIATSLSVKPEPRQFTKRQLKIIQGMVDGQTNIQIANELILSESAIKQEAVKIFRSLGVGTRQEAAAKAVAIGLLDDVSRELTSN